MQNIKKKVDPVCWVQAPLDAVLRDFANPRANDKYLPFVRNKDWYDGHSWASGVVPFAAGKNQVQPSSSD